MKRKEVFREGGRASRKPYKAEPDKNIVLTDEQVAQAKRRATHARRTIEDERIDRELGVE